MAVSSDRLRPNTAFRRLRGHRSPGEFAAAVRRAGREIGEQVSCDARYVGRVESGEIRCPNYAYERVFLHMFPGRTLADLGFEPREAVRGRRARGEHPAPGRVPVSRQGGATAPASEFTDTYEESDVLRRAFMTGGPAAVAALAIGGAAAPAAAGPLPHPEAVQGRRPGEPEADAVEEAVRSIRVLDDRHGADDLYSRAGQSLRTVRGLLDAGARRQAVADRLHAGAGELAISVGWLAHDSGRLADAGSHYAEALATARVAEDPALEAHAFCNTSFLARDAGRPHEAVRAAQAARRAAKDLGSARLRSLLALREAGGWAVLGDRRACGEALGDARELYAQGPADADPEWMSFYGEAELAGLEAQCWASLGEHRHAARCARRAVLLQDPHFTRNTALFTAELADNLAAAGEAEEAATAGVRAVELLGEVRSTRVRAMLEGTAERLRHASASPEVRRFLDRVRPVSA